MKLVLWFLLAGAGLGVMIGAYASDRAAVGQSTAISSGLIVAVHSTLEKFDKPLPPKSIKAGIANLPASGISAMLAMSAGKGGQRLRELQFQISEKVVHVPLGAAGINENSLAWGKLPRFGEQEVLAGADVARRERIHVAETSYTVTGGLPPAAGLFARCYLLPADERAGEHDEEADAAFRPAVLIPLGADLQANRELRKQVAELFPSKDFDRMASTAVMGSLAFYLTLVGEGLFLLGGSGVFIWLYAAASRRRTGILREPLAALSTHRRLNWAVHLVFFGLYLVTAAIVFRAPDLRSALQAVIHTDLEQGGGILQRAGDAYRTGGIARAALVTFAINFFIGSLLVLTLPSCVLPGSGSLVAGFRAVLWGLLLAPATLLLAQTMLPHSGTLLLEGEGYILATFFGLMVPLSLFRRKADASPELKGGYGWAVVLNLKGCVLVALVLAVAATYEATEVILQLKNLGAV